MKRIVLLIILIFMLCNAYAVSNINFNYEFNNSKTIVYPNIVKDDSIVLNLQSDSNSLYCKYSASKGYSFDSMEGTFDFSFQSLHKKSFSYLEEGVYKFYVKCKNDNNSIGEESELTFSIINPVKAEIYLSKNPPVSSGLIEITLKTTKQLSQKPTLSYSTGGEGYETIPLSGSNDLWKGYIIIQNNLKESIGSFKFRGIDLDGIIGEEITKGEIFLIDTIAPSVINEIDAEGRQRDIYLEWRFKEDYSYFNIYRSKFPNVEYTDFYKQIDKKSFTDNDVDVGRTYYYRITAVDGAGNEGELSYEISSVAIKEASNKSSGSVTGLDNELIGSVDAFLYDINGVYEDINKINSDLLSNSDKKEIVEILSLSSEVDNSEKELNSLENEVEGFKQQKITKSELDKKLANSRIKLNVIKKKTPESISIISQTSFSKKYDESKINEVLLMMNKDEGEISKLFSKSKKVMDSQKFSYESKVKNVEIYYMDGSKSVKGVIIKDITFVSGNNGSILEYIPKDIAASTSEITFKNVNYNVIKDDPILSFSDDTNKITYVLDKQIDLDSVKNIETFFLVSEEIEESGNNITGFAILENGLNSNLFVFIAILFIIVILIYFFIKSKRSKKDMELLDLISDKLMESKLYLETKNIKKLNEIYSELNEYYIQLSSKNKSLVYNKLITFNKQIKLLK